MKLSSLSYGVVCALALSACTKEPVPAPPAPPSPPPPPVPTAAAAPASSSGQSQADCVGPFVTTGTPEKITTSSFSAEKIGSMITVAGADADTTMKFGIIANIKDATGENLLNINKYIAFFQAEKSEAILVAGDTGETVEGLVLVLEPLAKTNLPVLVIPGNRESRADFTAAMDVLSKKYPNVINMSSTRLVKFDDASIVSLPGYYDHRFIRMGDLGCQYFKEDVAKLAEIVAAAKQPAVLLSHAEPYGKGNEAIDAFADGNGGDANLTAFLRTNAVPYGVFANMHESGGRATDLDSNVIREGEEKGRLYLNSGLADSTAWKLNDGTWSYGMVASLSVNGVTSSYKTLRVKQLVDAEVLEAKKLEPAQPGAVEAPVVAPVKAPMPLSAPKKKAGK